MNDAWIALLGALIGALTGLGTAWLTISRQEKIEHRKWLREQRQQAYSNALRYLSRALIIPVGHNISEIEKWYRGLADIQESLITLQVYCSQCDNGVTDASGELFQTMDDYSFATVATEVPLVKEEVGDVSGVVIWGVARIRKRIADVLSEVMRNAEADLGKSIAL